MYFRELCSFLQLLIFNKGHRVSRITWTTFFKKKMEIRLFVLIDIVVKLYQAKYQKRKLIYKA